jgi:hypothetical protein
MNKPPWPLRLLVWYHVRPLVGYLLLFLIAAYSGVVPRTGEVAVFNASVLPWVIFLLLLLNLPFIGGLARRLLLSEPEKRNHALEHGTIHFLNVKYGTSTGIGGRALKYGFRVSGARDPEDIRRAFRDLVSLPKEERWRVVIAKKCGSMIVIAQGVGVLSLLLAVVLFVLLPPSKTVLVIVLGAQLLLFLALRRPLGFFIQKRRLLSLEFAEARIRHIKKVEVNPLLERPPVNLVETIVH